MSLASLKLNQITSKEKFYNNTGINFIFSLNKNVNFLNNNSIVVKTENEENMQKTKFYINQIDFYDFYNTILECTPVFLDQTLTYNKESKDSVEDELCCICEDAKPDVMLECCVNKF
jgi:hypothetical protein